MKVKEGLDIMEDVMTIIVSVMALSGTWVAYENGFFHKVKHIVDHYHSIVEVEESKMIQDRTAEESKIKNALKDTEKEFE